jgi:hypothetical protein
VPGLGHALRAGRAGPAAIGQNPAMPSVDPATANPAMPSVDPATAVSYWLDTGEPVQAPSLTGTAIADVAIIGAGFTGLWTALRLLETDPGLRVAIVEMERVGFGAAGRNGGFCQASLTHGLENGLRHYPDEVDLLQREGMANLRAIVDFSRANGIECELEETGELSLADRPRQVDEFREQVERANAHGERAIFLDGEAARAEVHSPRWTAGAWHPDSCVMLNPAKLDHMLASTAKSIEDSWTTVGLQRGMRELVDEAFEEDRVLVDVHTAPESRWHVRVAHRMVDEQVRYGVFERVLARRPVALEGERVLALVRLLHEVD